MGSVPLLGRQPLDLLGVDRHAPRVRAPGDAHPHGDHRPVGRGARVEVGGVLGLFLDDGPLLEDVQVVGGRRLERELDLLWVVLAHVDQVAGDGEELSVGLRVVSLERLLDAAIGGAAEPLGLGDG